MTLLDIDDLKDFARAARLAQRRREIGKVREIIADELERYRDRARRARGRAARHRAARARRGRARRASSSASAAKLDAPRSRGPRRGRGARPQGIVNKLLHEPTVRVKDAAGTPRGELYADALGALFDLESRSPTE